MMASITNLLQRREQLKSELAELEAVLDVLQCTYCQRMMDPTGEPPANTFTDGAAYAAMTVSSEYACPQCGQAVAVVETVISEKIKGEWEEVDRHIGTRVRAQGKPYVVR